MNRLYFKRQQTTVVLTWLEPAISSSIQSESNHFSNLRSTYNKGNDLTLPYIDMLCCTRACLVAKSTSVSVGCSLSGSNHDRRGGKLFYLPSQIAQRDVLFLSTHIRVGLVLFSETDSRDLRATLQLRGHTGVFVGNTSKFRGLSHVAAFFKGCGASPEPERHDAGR